LYNEELFVTFTSYQILLGDQPKRMRWTRHLACMREKRNAYIGCWGVPPSQGAVWRIFLKWIIKKWDGTDWIRLVLCKDR